MCPDWRQSGMDPKITKIPLRNAQKPIFFARLRRDLAQNPLRNRQYLKIFRRRRRRKFWVFRLNFPIETLKIANFSGRRRRPENFEDSGQIWTSQKSELRKQGGVF